MILLGQVDAAFVIRLLKDTLTIDAFVVGSSYEAKRKLCELILEYEFIHVWKQNGVLF